MSNTESLITRISPTQRLDMIQKGYQPANNEHIKKYLQKIPLTESEKNQRLSSLYGDLRLDMGGGSDKFVDTNYIPNKTSTREFTSIADARNSINEELKNYGNNNIKEVSLLQNLNIDNNPKPNSKAFSIGVKFARTFNSLLIEQRNNPSIKSRMDLFKFLKEELTLEKNLKEGQNYQDYKDFIKGFQNNLG